MSEYIKSLRQHLGHTPLLQVGASVIVINQAGQMLMQQRTDCGSWGYAGGSVELGESVEQTAERELFEETGLKAQKLELLGVYSGEKMQYTYPNGDKVSIVDIVYTCHEYSGELKMQASEVSQLKFIDICDLPEDIFPPNRPAIEDYINKNKT